MALSEALRKRLNDFALNGLTIFRGILVLVDKNVTGETLRSLEVRTEFKPNSVKIFYRAVDTFTYRIEGRKAGTPPPIDPIIEWVDTTGLDLNPYAVQYAIGDSGTATPPAPFFEKVEEQLEPDLERFLQSDEIALLLFRRLDNVFNSRRR